MFRAARMVGPLGNGKRRQARDIRTLRRNIPSRNGTVTVCARVGRMLPAPRSRSAHARRGTGGARRRAVLRPFVRLELFDEEQAAGM